ncbi:hypothetical protein J0X14_18480 [Muricauda sp. CAU 1633]|uniref:hypothetical protein n=1 Tax=Allomuricauda sp. CAU 1633 TaxID=2816036 RepID=UPI001A8E5D59|nr:hypothetical protein [Muricauda sp. CAU 1633]MBO0324302.1 hypothetical protein [Muricauda sp. CAU 1633]
MTIELHDLFKTGFNEQLRSFFKTDANFGKTILIKHVGLTIRAHGVLYNNLNPKKTIYIEVDLYEQIKSSNEMFINISRDFSVDLLKSVEMFDRIEINFKGAMQISRIMERLFISVYGNHPFLGIKICNLRCSLIKVKSENEFLKLVDNQVQEIAVLGKVNKLVIETTRNLNSKGNIMEMVIENFEANDVELADNRGDSKFQLLASKIEKLSIEQNKFSVVEIVELNTQRLDFKYNSIENLYLKSIKPTNFKQQSSISLISNKITKRLLLDGIAFTAKGKVPSWMFKDYILTGTKYFGFYLEINEDNDFEEVQANNLNWTYESIVNFKHKDSPHQKLSTILLFKLLYDKKQDSPNNRLFRAFEKRFHNEHHKNFNFPLILGWISNKYGLSVTRPLIWILILLGIEILLLSLVSLACIESFMDNWGKLISLINPAHRTETILTMIDACPNSNMSANWIYIIDNSFRILIAYFIYQFIIAFRYLYDLK